MCSKYVVLYFFLSVTPYTHFLCQELSYFRLRAYVEKIKLSSASAMSAYSLKLKIPFAILCYLITIFLGDIEGLIYLSCVRKLQLL